jgi:pyruvate formate lyase activating enzyme
MPHLKIGGFLKQSLIDYPGKIAAVLFTLGCNFRCSYCHNPELVLPELTDQKIPISTEEIITYLSARKKWLDGVVVTGGEPTIHKGLPDFLQQLKEMGYAVKLDTNGSNPGMLEEIIRNQSVDYIAMDIKDIPEEKVYASITGIKNAADITTNIIHSIGILKHSAIEYEFRTTCIPKVHSAGRLAQITDYLGNVKRYTLNHYRAGITIETFNKS